MTKKFLESYLDLKNKRARKREFIIPDIYNFTNNFIGIETRKEYSYGMICYTGVDLDSTIVIDRLIENKIITATSTELIEIIDSYLLDLKQYKISNILSITSENKRFKLNLSDLKF
jgi:hypothetical protein